MRRFVTVAVACLALACLALAGCKAKETPPGMSSSPAASPRAAALDPATLGDVNGTIRFTGKVPAAVKIDTSMDPACGMSSAPEFNAEQYVVVDGKLANVYVYVKRGPAIAAGAVRSGPDAVLDQKGCRYTPHVIALMQGGTVEFRNSDVTMHNIHTMPAVAGNAAIDVSQGPKGAAMRKRFDAVETMLPVRCNNHPWMNAFINVSATPFFAVSDAAGHFDLHGLPAGNYVLGAVHEKLGEQTLQVTVAARSSAPAEFTFAMK